MKKLIFLCLLLNGCYVYHCPSNHAYQQPRIIYVEEPAEASASPTSHKVIKRTVKRTVQIVPESQLRGYMK